MNRKLVVSLLLALPLGCPAPEGDGADSATPSEEGSSTTGFTPDPGGSETGAPGTSTGMNDDTAGFITPIDAGGGIEIECDVWMQDCPEDEKCMPWANDGGSSWNATRCSPVSDSPGQVGDECMVEGSGVSGIDNCDVSSMCYYVDPETNVGTCVGFCEGSPEVPTCDAGFLCSIANNGVLILCRAECDPILQDCQGTAACLPAAGTDGFVCIIDASGEGGAAGEPCEFLNSCDPGLFCADAPVVPGCTMSAGCCSDFCDLTEMMPDDACTLMDQMCVPAFEEGMVPPGLEHVGICALPT